MNLERVAERAGVSIATVSRVLNNFRMVKASTRDRVLRAAEELNYLPNANARALSAVSKTVAALIPDFRDAALMTRLNDLDAQLQQMGLDLVVQATGGSNMRALHLIRTLLERRTRALILALPNSDEECLQLLQRYDACFAWWTPDQQFDLQQLLQLK
jgi:LacI family transcriptional regulator